MKLDVLLMDFSHEKTDQQAYSALYHGSREGPLFNRIAIACRAQHNNATRRRFSGPDQLTCKLNMMQAQERRNQGSNASHGLLSEDT